MLNKFVDEIISQGAEAVLPQNLNDEWLAHVATAAVDILHEAIYGKPAKDTDDSDVLETEESSVLIAAVMELTQSQRGYSAEIKMDEEDFTSSIKSYCISVAMEYICRSLNAVIEQPDIKNIFDQKRIMQLESSNPIITDALHNLVKKES